MNCILRPLNNKKDILDRQDAVKKIIDCGKDTRDTLLQAKRNIYVWLDVIKKFNKYNHSLHGTPLSWIIKQKNIDITRIDQTVQKLSKQYDRSNSEAFIPDEARVYFLLDDFTKLRSYVTDFVNQLYSFNSPLLSALAAQLVEKFKEAAIPNLEELIAGAQLHDEKLHEMCDRLPRIEQSLHEIGGIITFALYAQHESFCQATYNETENIGYKQGWNFLEPKKARSLYFDDEDDSKDQVVNDSLPDLPVVILTGSNMSGKSYNLKQNFFIQLLGQAFGFVPAQKANVRIYDHIAFVDRPGTDSEHNLSAYEKEVENWKKALDPIGEHSLILSDEAWSTTSPGDQCILLNALTDSVKYHKAHMIMSNHNDDFIESQASRNGVSMHHFKTNIRGADVTFTHKLAPGPDDSRAIEIARALGLQEKILHRAEQFLSGKVTPVTRVQKTKPVPVTRYTEAEREKLKKKMGNFLFCFPFGDALKPRDWKNRFPCEQNQLRWRFGREDADDSCFRVSNEQDEEYSFEPVFALFSGDRDFGEFSPIRDADYGVVKNQKMLVEAQKLLMESGSRDPKEIYERQRLFKLLGQRDNQFELMDITNDILRTMCDIAGVGYARIDLEGFNSELLDQAFQTVKLTGGFDDEVKEEMVEYFIKILNAVLKIAGLTPEQAGIEQDLYAVQELLRIMQRMERLHDTRPPLKDNPSKKESEQWKQWYKRQNRIKEKMQARATKLVPDLPHDEYEWMHLATPILELVDTIQRKVQEAMPVISLYEPERWPLIREEIEKIYGDAVALEEKAILITDPASRAIISIHNFLSEQDHFQKLIDRLRSLDSVHTH
ncbi:MAG: hypothetical protein GF384_07195, partial [Elusimicrobia bacterium]|nr:hypothetical protein [Elusimicrobiota bacterium]MBD3412456.1 hypothetical protein [Elusimicrobiota bacterium]